MRLRYTDSEIMQVKGGGHASNADFSSTPGVQISMTRFNQVTYSASAGTVEIGTGLIWDDVYGALEQYNVNIVGGRVSGVGVAGFTLGGGKPIISSFTLWTTQIITFVQVTHGRLASMD